MIYPSEELKEFAELKNVEMIELVLLHENDNHFNLIIPNNSDLAQLGSLSYRFNFGLMGEENDIPDEEDQKTVEENETEDQEKAEENGVQNEENQRTVKETETKDEEKAGENNKGKDKEGEERRTEMIREGGTEKDR